MDRLNSTARPWGPRFPRRRGDGPRTARRARAAHTFPPQARGWTHDSHPHVRRDYVSPAGAGMDLRYQTNPPPAVSFPRRRGDGPQPSAPPWNVPRFPPQARGWTLLTPERLARLSVSPAGAGMDPIRAARYAARRGFPRRRGDGPGAYGRLRARRRFPPQARGWTSWLDLLGRCRPVSPAGAGMDPAPPHNPRGRTRFPRRRGDGPSVAPAFFLRPTFPPQARGWTRYADDYAAPLKVSPAGAGMDPFPFRCRRPGTSFPRRRGDGPWQKSKTWEEALFPPQARGWTPGGGPPRAEKAVSPAGAGMDRGDGFPPALSPGFPRRRGDGPKKAARKKAARKFPPQARGWTSSIHDRNDRDSVSPAGAGMDPPRTTTRPPGAGFPRRRGDGPQTGCGAEPASRFPPQARGWTLDRRLREQDHPVSPAGAGMDPIQS